MFSVISENTECRWCSKTNQKTQINILNLFKVNSKNNGVASLRVVFFIEFEYSNIALLVDFENVMV